MDKLYNYFKNLDSNDKIVQSFLIGNVLYNDIKEELNRVISDFILKKEVKIDENPDIYVLENTIDKIGKEDIRELLNKVGLTSQFTNKKIYIIENTEKLNDASCNALLKTVEEPPEGVYAFLLTSNMNSVLPTISSRCQKIFVSSGLEDIEESTVDEETLNKIIEYIEIDGVKSISKNKDIYSIIEDRNKLFEVLKGLLNKYNKALHDMINNKEGSKTIIKNNDLTSISKKILIINETMNKLEYALNKNLSIDRLLIDMWRCKNENN